MEFGGVSDLSARSRELLLERTCFDLPETQWMVDPTQSHLIHPEQLRIGPPVWGEDAWVGSVYPKGTKSKDYLWHFSRQFPVIELNSTFYSAPTFEGCSAWAKQVPAHFRFCPKVHQGISRELGIGEVESKLLHYIDAVKGFGKNLGPAFLQLPPQFELGQWRALEQVLKMAKENELRLAVEFRNASWFENSQLKAPIARMLKHYGASALILDTTTRRDLCHSTLTTDFAMVRVLGNDLHASDEMRAGIWAEKILEWVESRRLAEIYWFAHEPQNALSAKWIQMVIEAWNVLAPDYFQLEAWKESQLGFQL